VKKLKSQKEPQQKKPTQKKHNMIRHFLIEHVRKYIVLKGEKQSYPNKHLLGDLSNI